MAGPISDPDWSKFKINSLMAVPKNNGDYRPVGILSAPEGFSFNDGVDLKFLDQWPVKMTTAHQFAQMLIEAGTDAFMMCQDIKDAYKLIPCEENQRHLQAFSFFGNMFVDL